jgi:hypothetical protein
MRYSISLVILVASIFVAVLALAPGQALAQDENPAAALVTDTGTVSGTIQITAEDPQAIRSLLEGEAVIPGDYSSYGWATFWALVFGGLGGLVFELLRLRGLLPLPHLYPEGQIPSSELFKVDSYVRPKRVIDLGFVARIFVGAMAALAVLLVVSPPQRMQFIAAMVLAGSAGASIFDSLRARLTASLAIADAADVRMKSEDLQKRLDRMEELIKGLQAGTALPVPEGLIITPEMEASVNGKPAETVQTQLSPLDSARLEELNRTLAEAKMISRSIEQTRTIV